LRHYLGVPFFERRLPELEELGRPVFVTWTLEAGLCRNPRPPLDGVIAGAEFESIDRLLNEARTGPLYLRDHETAAMVERTMLAHAEARQLELMAYVVMPNHLHMLLTPLVRLADLTARLQSLTARRANDLRELQGAPFWCAQNYEHLVSGRMELERIRVYIEEDPVRVGLASAPVDYAYSSARGARVGRPLQLAAAS
jgi:REP element-mobilizing transposase RayT